MRLCGMKIVSKYQVDVQASPNSEYACYSKSDNVTFLFHLTTTGLAVKKSLNENCKKLWTMVEGTTPANSVYASCFGRLTRPSFTQVHQTTVT